MEERQIPVIFVAAQIEEIIYSFTGKVVKINLPLQTPKEQELFIKLINIMGITI